MWMPGLDDSIITYEKVPFLKVPDLLRDLARKLRLQIGKQLLAQNRENGG